MAVAALLAMSVVPQSTCLSQVALSPYREDPTQTWASPLPSSHLGKWPYQTSKVTIPPSSQAALKTCLHWLLDMCPLSGPFKQARARSLQPQATRIRRPGETSNQTCVDSAKQTQCQLKTFTWNLNKQPHPLWNNVSREQSTKTNDFPIQFHSIHDTPPVL